MKKLLCFLMMSASSLKALPEGNLEEEVAECCVPVQEVGILDSFGDIELMNADLVEVVAESATVEEETILASEPEVGLIESVKLEEQVVDEKVFEEAVAPVETIVIPPSKPYLIPENDPSISPIYYTFPEAAYTFSPDCYPNFQTDCLVSPSHYPVSNVAYIPAFEGFYVGGSLGGHLAEAASAGNALGTFNDAGTIGSFPVNLQKRMFSRGAAGMAYIGYGLRWCSYYLAAEGFAQFGPASLKSSLVGSEQDTLPEAYITLAQVNAYLDTCQLGIDLLPGWSPNCATLIYGRLGVSSATATLSPASTNSGINGGVSWNLSQTLFERKRFAALRAGGGLEQRLTDRLSLRADYIFTYYGKIATQGSLISHVEPLPPLALPITVNSTTSLHLYDHAALLGLNYRFCCQEPILSDPCYTQCAYQGFYLGGSLGGSALTAGQTGSAVSIDAGFSNLTTTANAPKQLNTNQFQGTLFLGYGREWRNLYLAGEFIIAATAPNSMDSNGQGGVIFSPGGQAYSTSYETSVKASAWQFGLDMRPGFLLTPLTLLYGRVGVSAAQIKAQSESLTTGREPIISLSWSIPEATSTHEWKPTLRLGLGVEQLLCSKLHLRADYLFTNYGKISFNNTVTGTDSLGNTVTLNNNLSSHLQNHAVTLGISYYFH